MNADQMSQRLHETFRAYVSADGAATRAFVRYQAFEVSEAEVHRLQRLAALAAEAHIEAMNAVARGDQR